MTTDVSAQDLGEAADIRLDMDILERPRYSIWKDMFRRLSRNKMAIVGAVYIIVLAFSAIAAPLVTPYGRDEPDFKHNRAAPTVDHVFGTDKLGRDLYTRIIYGGRVSLGVAFVGSVTALVIGVLYGAISGFFGGWIDDVMMRFVDLMFGFPTLLFIILMLRYM